MSDVRILEEDVYKQLREKYGDELVAMQPQLPGGAVYPDLAVFTDESRTDPHLLVECSSLRTPHRIQRDLEEISQAAVKTGASYGALVGPDVTFVFTSAGSIYRTSGDFPPLHGEEPERRPILSTAELDFLISRCLEAQENLNEVFAHEGEIFDGFLQSLHLLIEARQNDISLDSDIDASLVDEIYSKLNQRYSWYDRGEHIEPSLLEATAGIFRGYDLIGTEPEILESLLDLGNENRRSGEYATPLGVARQMVRLSGVNQGDLVLDPAAGQGTILSVAAREGMSGVGVEINVTALRLAAVYTDLLHSDAELILGDFFELDENGVELPGPFDNVIIDPPMGMRVDGEGVPYSDGRNHLRSEEAFLAAGLSLLKEGGRITMTVPATFLNGLRQQWIRELVLEEFQLDSVIQIIDGPVYRYTSIDTAIITISKQRAVPGHEVQYEILEGPDDPEAALEYAVDRITDGSAETIEQTELEASFDIRRVTKTRAAESKIRSKFAKVAPLESIADVHSGNPPRDLVEKAVTDTVRYLSISDVSEGPSRHGDRFILENEAKIADSSCVLLATIGENTYTYIPPEAVAPAQDLAILRFDSPDEALVYSTFLSSEFGAQQLDALKSGRGPRSRVPIRDLRQMLVPQYNSSELEQRADAIRRHQREIEQLEDERKRLEQEQQKLAERADDLLGGGEDDE